MAIDQSRIGATAAALVEGIAADPRFVEVPASRGLMR